MVEVLATGDFYFINLLRARQATSSPKVSPFVRLGAGFGVGDPNTVNGNMARKMQNFALPMGLGLRMKVSDNLALTISTTRSGPLSPMPWMALLAQAQKTTTIGTAREVLG